MRRWPLLSRFPPLNPARNSTSPTLPSSHDTRLQLKFATSYTGTRTLSLGVHCVNSTRRMQVGHRLWVYCNSVIYMPPPNSVSFISPFRSGPDLRWFKSYENPVITATSRDSIGDIHSLSQYLSELDAPKPTSLLRSLFGLARNATARESWFQISRMWTEVDDVCENESFGESAVTTSNASSPSLDFSIGFLCQMDIGDALWSTHSIFSSFPDYMPNAI